MWLLIFIFVILLILWAIYPWSPKQMSIICRRFGHTPDKWYLEWQEHWSATDGNGRVHRGLDARCKRCEQMFHIGKVHMPKEKQ